MEFLRIEALFLLWWIPLVAALFAWASWRRQQLLATFADTRLLTPLIESVSAQGRTTKAMLTLLAGGAMIFGLARPAWNEIELPVKRRGRDLLFVLDVSRSMLAQDVVPNRLERAKRAIRNCVESLQGDRVGLLVFAGRPVLLCPMTIDYGFFNMILDDVTTTSAGKGGTLVGDALRAAITVAFAPGDHDTQYRDVILISDGGDHDSIPEAAARQLGQEGVRIIALGLGDDRDGVPIPVKTGTGAVTYIKDHTGEIVKTRLNHDTLRPVALSTPGGRYIPAATGVFDLAEIYHTFAREAEHEQLRKEKLIRKDEKFQIFLCLAFVLLCCEPLIRERIRRQSR